MRWATCPACQQPLVALKGEQQLIWGPHTPSATDSRLCPKSFKPYETPPEPPHVPVETTVLELWNGRWWRWYMRDGVAYALLRQDNC